MKNVLLLFSFFMFCAFAHAQKDKVVSLNKDTNLLDVVYYHDNGEISQTGSYTLDGKLHGNWMSYNSKGEKMASANYDHGKKVGKWFYWQNETLKEVDYNKNEIVSVIEWNDKTSVALSN